MREERGRGEGGREGEERGSEGVNTMSEGAHTHDIVRMV